MDLSNSSAAGGSTSFRTEPAVGTAEIRIKGRTITLPAARICGCTVIAPGKWCRVAQIHDELWTTQFVDDPLAFIAGLKRSHLRADVLTFAQKLPDTSPRYKYHHAWENFAVIDTSNFEKWWTGLPQEARKNFRRAGRRGVVLRVVELDDAFIEGVTAIYNETPFRQGKRFPHYGKDFATVKREISTLLDRSEFLAAYYNDELIGFIKLVHLGAISSILHIVSKEAHYDKRPSNALITRAAEICRDRGISYLLYGNYSYGNKKESPLTEFKRRNGFQKVLLPRYYVPVTARGRFYVALRLYRGVIGLMPAWLVCTLVAVRAFFYKVRAALQARIDPGAATGSVPARSSG